MEFIDDIDDIQGNMDEFIDNAATQREKRVNKLLSDLAVIATILPGQTLSSSTMTVIDHRAWSTMLWRTYTSENRSSSINVIKGILEETVLLCDLLVGLNTSQGSRTSSITDNHSIDQANKLINAVKLAITGFANLRETYQNDYYHIGIINRTIDTVTCCLSKLQITISNYYKSLSVTIDELSTMIAKGVVLENDYVDFLKGSTCKDMNRDISKDENNVCHDSDNTEYFSDQGGQGEVYYLQSCEDCDYEDDLEPIQTNDTKDILAQKNSQEEPIIPLDFKDVVETSDRGDCSEEAQNQSYGNHDLTVSCISESHNTETNHELSVESPLCVNEVVNNPCDVCNFKLQDEIIDIPYEESPYGESISNNTFNDDFYADPYVDTYTDYVKQQAKLQEREDLVTSICEPKEHSPIKNITTPLNIQSVSEVCEQPSVSNTCCTNNGDVALEGVGNLGLTNTCCTNISDVALEGVDTEKVTNTCCVDKKKSTREPALSKQKQRQVDWERTSPCRVTERLQGDPISYPPLQKSNLSFQQPTTSQSVLQRSRKTKSTTQPPIQCPVKSPVQPKQERSEEQKGPEGPKRGVLHYHQQSHGIPCNLSEKQMGNTLLNTMTTYTRCATSEVSKQKLKSSQKEHLM
jgi:hypothetical protein